METTTVTVRFTAVPAHVRTARLVAAAVARRSGVEENILDEVRLAVGEACSRAVDLHRRFCPQEPVTVALTDGSTSFTVEVTDRAPEHNDAADALGRIAGGQSAGGVEVDDLDGDALSDTVGLAVIAGLVDDLQVSRTTDGLSLRMTWPVDASGLGVSAQRVDADR